MFPSGSREAPTIYEQRCVAVVGRDIYFNNSFGMYEFACFYLTLFPAEGLMDHQKHQTSGNEESNDSYDGL